MNDISNITNYSDNNVSNILLKTNKFHSLK
jgi:hypothetical protein